jgi:pyruvate dehydrogenase E2 component (dihydrolipoamide acetyltransferase)
MAIELKMPQMGYDMTEGTLVKWLKEVGESVKKNEPIAEIETDKAVVEFETESDGILLKIIAREGSIIPVGHTIAIIGNLGESIDSNQYNDQNTTRKNEPNDIPSESLLPEPNDDESNLDEVANRTTNPKRIVATPIARRLADELGISLSTITGTGPNGRITKTDINSLRESSSEAELIQINDNDNSKNNEHSQLQSTNNIGYEKQPLTRMRQQIARVTTKSKTEKPHFYVSAEIDMTNTMELRKEINEHLSSKGTKITVNDLIIKASIEALKKHPKFNAYYDNDGIKYNKDINIAVAIANEEGLIVPAILNCGSKSLSQISLMVKDLAQRASSGTLSPQEYTGGTFAISNLGMFDVTSFVAIIHPPQSAVLAVGTVIKKPVVRNNEIQIGQTMIATISADHRIVDGAEGAQFLVAIKSLLENPMGMVI